MDFDSKVVTRGDLSELCELLVDMAGDWELLLSAIGVRGAERDQIRLKHPYSPKLCLVEGLELWLVTTDTPTYGSILRGLRGKLATNLPLATLVQEFASKKTSPLAVNTVLPEPCVSKATEQSKTTTPPPPVGVEATAPLHPSTKPATVAMNPKTLSQPASCDSTSYEAMTSEEGPTFPRLPTVALTKHQKDVLEGRLILETERIRLHFGSLVMATHESLDNRVDLKKVVFSLKGFPFLKQVEVTSDIYKGHLNSATSLYDIFDVIEPYYSFFDYALIELLITTFGTDDDKQRLAEYKLKFTEYCKRRVCECPIKTFGSEGEDEILLVAKLEEVFEEYTLKTVKKFRSKLCEILEVPDEALRFIGAKEGCIEFYFAMFRSLDSVIFLLSARQRERLRGEGVVELRGGGHHCSLEGGGGGDNSGSDSEVESEEGPLSEFFSAAESGNTAKITSLLGRVPVNSRDSWGQSPLMLAVEGGHTAIIEGLISHGADLNLQDNVGWTALHLAALQGHTATMKALVAAGADLNILDMHGVTPLMEAAYDGRTAAVQSLVAIGADMNIRDGFGWTALYHAVVNGHSAIVDMLMAAGADMNIGSKDGVTVLMLAAGTDLTDILQSLLAAGADMNIQDWGGRTALICALQGGHLEAAEVLIKFGAGLSQQEKATGWTALFFAAKEGSLPLVRLLLERGADSTHKDKEGVTAFDVAETLGHIDAMIYLEKHTPAATEAVSEEAQPTAPTTEAHQPPMAEALAESSRTSNIVHAPERETIRARVFKAVKILAERFKKLALPGRAKKREEEREGARPRQRRNKPGWMRGQGRAANQQREESAESRNIRNITS